MPDDEGSVTRWLGGLKAGSEAAAQQLWERYCARMVGLARENLRAGRRGDMGSDEEDAALSAFDSFCTGAARGNFPLWPTATTSGGFWHAPPSGGHVPPGTDPPGRRLP